MQLRRTGEVVIVTAVAAAVAVGAVVVSAPGQIGTGVTAVAPDPESPSWPRTFTRNNHRLVVYQPQIDRWDEFTKLSARAAVAVTPRGENVPDFGTIRFTAATAIDFGEHAVRVGQRNMAGMVFPDIDSSRYLEVRGVVEGLLPEGAPIIMSIDEIVPFLELEESADELITMNADPPPIAWSQEPALMVAFDGDPQWAVMQGSLQVAVNATAPLFHETADGTYWLLRDDGAIMTRDLSAGPWEAAQFLPEALEGAAPTGNPDAVIPKVIVRDEPTALIITDGPPRHRPIPPTRIAEITNTDSDLFLYTGDFQFYLLLGGRWFRAGSLDGPWNAANATLPEEFGAIPPEDPAGRVLASVPGTPEARSARLMATVPRSARISRSEATVEVTFDGPPRFEPVEGSMGVSVAVNTDFDVFQVEGRYFCCYEAVWFEAGDPLGPWIVCDRVPPAIYTIPELSPKFRVTDVKVGNVTPDYVEMSHTGQYTGEIITLGLITAGVVYAVSQADNVHFRGHVSLGSIDASWNTRSRRDPYKAWGRAAVTETDWARDARGPGEPGGPRKGNGALSRGERGDFYAGPNGEVYRRGANGRWQQRSGSGWSNLDSSDRRSNLNRQHRARATGARNAGNFNRNRGRGGGGRGGGRR